MNIPNWLIVLLIFIIVLLDLTIHKKQIGIVILHDNDHTLNKIVQYTTAFFERQEAYFTILVLKVKEKYKDIDTDNNNNNNKNKNKNKSTGSLFNIGYRQLNRADYYLFLDTSHCQLDNYFNLLVSPPQYQAPPPRTVQIMPEICGVLVSREYFKEFGGFSNIPTANFKDFLHNLKKNHKNKTKQESPQEPKYHIVEKTQITPHTLRVMITF